MDIWDIEYKEGNKANLDVMLKAGQTVTITRIVTIAYEVDIAEILDGTDKESISVKNLILDECRNNDISVSSGYTDTMDIADDTVISVEIA